MAKTVSVTLTANTNGFTAALTKAGSVAKSTAAGIQTSMGKALDGVERQSVHIDTVGSSLTRMGLVGAAGLALTAKAAMDWESQWAGVTKTVDGSAQQMAVLEGELRGLAKTLPASHQEIAAVAEAAGQLGVQRESITSFTKTMIDLGETTNLSAEEASTSLAQFMNIMGTSQADVGRLGATIVALGNAGASTERDIVQMGQRIAGAGRQVGLSETQVFAFANALSSVGVEAEAGGTAISSTFLRIDQAVRNGGQGLETLARTAGMSGAQFRTAFQKDAAGALNSFVVGLGKVQASGGDTTKVLKDLGITGIREADAMRRLASGGTLLADSLKMGNQAWRENSALVEEAAKRYATTESQARIAWNQIKDAAISGGQAILPIVAQVATAVGAIAEAFGSMPGPVRIATVALVATVTAMGLLGGAGLKAVSGIAGLRAAFTGLGASATAAGRAMKIAQLAIPGVGIALFAATTAMQLWAGNATQAESSAGEFAAAMQTIEGAVTAATAALNENVRAAAVQGLQSSGAFEQADKLGLSYATLADAALGSAPAVTKVHDAIRAGYRGTSEQVKASMELGRAFRVTADSAGAALKAEQDRRSAMGPAAAATQTAEQAAIEHAEAVQDEVQALQDLIAKTFEYTNAQLQLSGGAIAAEAAMDAAAVAAKKNGENLDIATGKGRANQQSLDNLVNTSKEYVTSLLAQQRPAQEVAAASERFRAGWVKSAVAMGMGRKEANSLSRELFALPDEVRSQVVLEGGKISRQEAKDLNKALKDIPPESRARIVTIANTKGAKEAKQAIAEVKSKEVIAKATGKGVNTVKEIDEAIKKLKSKAVRAEAKAAGKPAVDALDNAIEDLKSKRVQVTAATSGQGSLSALQGAIGAIRGKTVYVTVKRREAGGGDAAGATGGLFVGGGFSMRGPLRRSAGGPVWGAGTATSDSIPALLSNGEFVINAKSVSMLGADRLDHINRTGTLPAFKDGGPVGFAAGGAVDINFLYRLIAQLRNPMGELAALTSTRATRTTENTAAQRALATAAANRKRVHGRSNETAADRKKVDDAYTKAMDKAKGAAERLADANANLSNKQREVADTARAMSTQFQDAYRTTSTDARDWIELMQQGSTDIVGFTNRIATLRKQGLNETLVQQIISMGAVAGSELATQISGAGGTLVGQLNKANAALEKAADNLGFKGTTTTGRVSAFATGGLLSGPGHGTSDSMTIRASTGEYVVNAAATSRNLPLLHAINYGARTSHPSYGPGYATGGVVQRPAGVDANALARAMSGMSVMVQNPWTGEYHASRMRVVAGSVYADQNRKAEVSF